MKKILVIAMTLSFLGLHPYAPYPTPCSVQCNKKDGCAKDGVTYKNGEHFLDYTSNPHPTCDAVQMYWNEHCDVKCNRKSGCVKNGILHQYGDHFEDYTSNPYPNCDAVQKYWQD